MISVNKYSNKRTYYQITGHKRTIMYRQRNAMSMSDWKKVLY